ncbi:hypothetical protein ACOSQ4_013996 [Xanthoceras sorbifolium]
MQKDKHLSKQLISIFPITPPQLTHTIQPNQNISTKFTNFSSKHQQTQAKTQLLNINVNTQQLDLTKQHSLEKKKKQNKTCKADSCNISTEVPNPSLNIAK